MKLQSYSLSLDKEIEIRFLNYGGIIQSLLVPDKNGVMDDVVLGFNELRDYEENQHYFGALIGRYANRIAGGKFTLDEKEFRLTINTPPNSLHGGTVGLNRVFWEVKKNADKRSYTLIHDSAHLHEGYPGHLHVEVIYRLSSRRELILDYKAVADRPTPVNLTNHTYFNLSGMKVETILEHELWINSEAFTEINSNLIPTGRILPLNESLDFRLQKKIGRDISKIQGGYDHNYILKEGSIFDPKVRLYDPFSGRVMEVFTTEPALQFYSGNFLDGTILGKKGVRYLKHAGLCLETQHFPDSPHYPHFPNTILRPGETFRSQTIYKFGTKDDVIL
jgi:aldose 1-epimerase